MSALPHAKFSHFCLMHSSAFIFPEDISVCVRTVLSHALLLQSDQDL